MSIATLVQVYDEVRRLAIAGSSVAPGDFRLKKLIAPLTQAGANAPVFTKVAQGVQAVVDSSDQTAAPALLELTTLVNAILYTQGQTGCPGELQPIPITDLGLFTTHTSARTIKPLIEALTSKGSGRAEVIKDAVERDLFRDLRLIQPALHALDDPYPEVAELIAEKVLPLYGPTILPQIRAALDIKSKTAGQQRRLHLLHRLDPTGSRDLIEKALDQGSKEMKVAAVSCLGSHPSDIPKLIEHSQAKARDLCVSALRAMLKLLDKVPAFLDPLRSLVDKGDVRLISDEVSKTASPLLVQHICEKIHELLTRVLKENDAKSQGTMIIQLNDLVSCLDPKSQGIVDSTLIECFDQRQRLGKIKSTFSGADFIEEVARRMSAGSPLLQERLIREIDSLNGQSYVAALNAARQSLTPAAFFDKFSPVLLATHHKKSEKSRERADELSLNLMGAMGIHIYRPGSYITYDHDHSASSDIDPRWLDLAIKISDVNLACALATPGIPALEQFLFGELKSTKDEVKRNQLFAALVRANTPNIAETLIGEIKQRIKTGTGGSHTRMLINLIPALPPNAVPLVEELLAAFPDATSKPLIDALHLLKSKSE